MNERVEKSGLQVDAALAAFIEGEVLAPQGKDSAAFWAGLAALLARFAPVNRALVSRLRSTRTAVGTDVTRGWKHTAQRLDVDEWSKLPKPKRRCWQRSILRQCWLRSRLGRR